MSDNQGELPDVDGTDIAVAVFRNDMPTATYPVMRLNTHRTQLLAFTCQRCCTEIN